MDGDFPAAHSMDTEWFAVDAKGHVGVFISGENGAVPRGCVQGNYLSELLDDLRGQPAAEDANDDDVALDDDADLDEGVWRGLFVYEYADDYVLGVYMPYENTRKPAAALHVDQLPPRWRKLVKQVQFPDSDFATDSLIQPADHVECEFWSDVVWCLAGDGRTVRRLSGSEEEFAAYCRELRQQHPDESKNLIFEGVEDEPPAKPKPRRKKKGN
jgi:hypothetical protein